MCLGFTRCQLATALSSHLVESDVVLTPTKAHAGEAPTGVVSFGFPKYRSHLSVMCVSLLGWLLRRASRSGSLEDGGPVTRVGQGWCNCMSTVPTQDVQCFSITENYSCTFLS